MKNLQLTIILLTVLCHTANAKKLFIDFQFDYKIKKDIKYGEAFSRAKKGNMDLLLDVYSPVGENVPVLKPGLVYIHGGAFHGGSKDKDKVVKICENFTKRGYVVLSIDYRLKKHKPPEDEPGAAELYLMNSASQDAAQAVRWLKENAKELGVDPNHIAIGGASAGAITALFTGYQEADVLGEGAEVQAILDLWGGLYGNEHLVDSDDPPVFIYHGDKDKSVKYEFSQKLTARCKEVGLDHYFFTIKGGKHSLFDSYHNGIYDENGNGIIDKGIETKTHEQLSVEFLYKHLNLIKFTIEPLK